MFNLKIFNFVSITAIVLGDEIKTRIYDMVPVCQGIYTVIVII